MLTMISVPLVHAAICFVVRLMLLARYVSLADCTYALPIISVVQSGTCRRYVQPAKRAPAEEYEQSTCDDGAHAGNIGNIHMMLFGDRRRDRPHVDHLLVGGVGEPPECQSGYAEGDQHQSRYCHGFHFSSFRSMVDTP
jgi:hypothetical protein